MDIMELLENLKLLRDDMVSKNENFDIFEFKYKNKNYFVVVEVFNQDKKPKFALAKLIFLRTENKNIEDKFETWANSIGFLEKDIKKIRRFFSIEFSKDGNFFQSLYKSLGLCIPQNFNHIRKNEINKKNTLLNYVIENDPKDPNRKYLFDVRKTGGKRSPFNDEKTKIMRPEIYNVFKARLEVSFFYSTEMDDQRDDETILQNYRTR